MCPLSKAHHVCIHLHLFDHRMHTHARLIVSSLDSCRREWRPQACTNDCTAASVVVVLHNADAIVLGASKLRTGRRARIFRQSRQGRRDPATVCRLSECLSHGPARFVVGCSKLGRADVINIQPWLATPRSHVAHCGQPSQGHSNSTAGQRRPNPVQDASARLVGGVRLSRAPRLRPIRGQ